MASDDGQIMRVKTRYGNPTSKLISQFDSEGYKIVRLHYDNMSTTRTVSRLMCMAFFGDEPDLQAAHKDGNPSNNTIDNLYWATAKQNSQDRVNHGTGARGEKVHGSFLKENDIRRIREEYKSLKEKCPHRYLPNGSVKKIAEKYGVPNSEYIIQICKRRVWAHVT